MKKIALVLVILNSSICLKAQNLFPYKLSNCVTESFCLDCGDEQANVDKAKFAELVADLNKSNDYSRVSGRIMLQVLIDSTGKGCVLSHTDQSNNPLTQNIVTHLNDFNGWIPARDSNKIVGHTSINLSVEIKQGTLTSKIERVDQKAFMKSFDHPADPEIYNKEYVYKNENLKRYNIKTWNSENSNLPNNFDDNIAIDRDNIVWVTVDEGLVEFNGTNFAHAEQNITDKGKYFGYHAIAVDNSNVKWVYGGKNIYSFDGCKWTLYDPKVIGIDGAYKIINNERSGEVFFCSDKGLVIHKGGNWETLDQGKIKELPSNRVYFAKRDSKNRLWIGTFSGSILIDEKGKVTSFNKTDGVLKGKCISAMDEGESGEVFLALYEYDRKDKKSANNDEGIAICYTDGEIKQFTTANSGMPFNNVSQVLYDRREKVLWIATDRAGLVRYDLKNTWENYHNKNSDIPTSYIADMAFDKNGVLYLATRQGLVKIERK